MPQNENSKNQHMQEKPQKIVQTAGRAALGEFAPDFAHFNDDVLFGKTGTTTTSTSKLAALSRWFR
ncbi:MAG: hypothetical protein SOT81_07280 [Treponema sp.]|nr:hypothetical protein [Treponema sp.]